MSSRRYHKNCDGVHLSSAGADYTLCGDALEGDDEFDAVIDVPSGPVTCRRCIDIIEHCRGVRTRR